LQCTKELKERRNEWTRTLHITEYEPCYEEDYDVEDFLPHNSSSDALCDPEMEITGWEKENTPSNCDGSKDENCNQGVNNDSDIKGKTECKQASVKSSVTDEKKESSKRRKKHLCPLKGCKSQVTDLPRHLRDVHKWTREKVQKATSKFGMRKSFSSAVVEKGKENKWKDYHHHRKCPVSGCHSTVKRLSHHLQQVHKEIRKGSSEYKFLLKEARSIKPWQLSSLV